MTGARDIGMHDDFRVGREFGTLHPRNKFAIHFGVPEGVPSNKSLLNKSTFAVQNFLNAAANIQQGSLSTPFSNFTSKQIRNFVGFKLPKLTNNGTSLVRWHPKSPKLPILDLTFKLQSKFGITAFPHNKLRLRSKLPNPLHTSK